MPRKGQKAVSTQKKNTAIPPQVKAPEAKPAPAAVETKALVNIAPMLNLLRDLDADIAREAATALGASGNPAAVEALLAVVANENGYHHAVVRSAAAAGLANFKDLRAVEVLISAVRDPITDPSTEAIRALAKLADARAIPVLIEVVKNDSNYFAGSVRRAAVAGLASFRGEAALAVLKEVATNSDEDSVIREESWAAIKSD